MRLSTTTRCNKPNFCQRQRRPRLNGRRLPASCAALLAPILIRLRAALDSTAECCLGERALPRAVMGFKLTSRRAGALIPAVTTKSGDSGVCSAVQARLWTVGLDDTQRCFKK